MKIEEVRDLIGKIGSQGYKDGNSLTEGWTYHPIPFDEFKDLKFHKDAPEQEHNKMREVLADKGITPHTLLDLGANIGYHSFRFARELDAEVVAVEADPLTAQAGQAVAEYTHSDVTFHALPAQEFIKREANHFDLCVFLNCHMWIEKQGHDTVVMEWLRHHVKWMFFQTAHQQSGGMYRVPIPNLRGVRDYLEKAGFDVELVQETPLHGGIRGMFFCEARHG